MKKDNLSKKQILHNLFTNGLNFAVNVSYGLILSPFLIKYLGIGSFGIVQIALSISAYMGMISTSLNQANNRYISLALAADDERAAVSTVNTTLVLYGLFFLGILPFILGLSLYSNYFLNIPEQDLVTSKAMFFMIIISYLLVMITTVFVSPLYAKNRLDIIQGINIVRNALKLALTVGFVLYFSRNVDTVGLSHLLAAVISTIIAIFAFLNYLPSYRFKFSDYNKEKAKAILRLSGWTLVQYAGTLLFLQTDIIIVNILLGHKLSGQYGVLMQWNTLLLNVASITSVVISPIILIKYSKQEFVQLRAFLSKAIRLQGIYISLLATLVFVFAEEILIIWLGSVFAILALPLKVTVFHIAFSQAIRPLYALNTAYNQVAGIGKVTLVSGIVHMATSFVLIKYLGLGIMGPVFSTAVYSVLLNVVFLPTYVSRYLNQPKRIFYKNFIPPLVCFLVVAVVGEVIKSMIDVSSWFLLMLAGGLTAAVAILLLYLFVFNDEEKRMVASFAGRG